MAYVSLPTAGLNFGAYYAEKIGIRPALCIKSDTGGGDAPGRDAPGRLARRRGSGQEPGLEVVQET